MKTHWFNLLKNKFLCIYFFGKLKQVQKKHEEAIEFLNQANELSENKNPYVFFKRAWSYKVFFYFF
jgi:hypothetical protein